MAAVTHPVITSTEFRAAMERAGWRAPIELIDGEVVVIPPSGGEASLAQTEMVHRLRTWRDSPAGSGLVLTDVFVTIADAYLAPDVAWWEARRTPSIDRGAIRTVPNLVAEVLSPATRDNDLGPKRARYLGAGVDELWIIDPADRSMLVVRAGEERRLAESEQLDSAMLPGFRLPVSELFIASFT